MRARWYDPATGRFVSEDPAGDGTNWYAYCGNDPVNCADPEGCCAVAVPAAAIGLVILAAALVIVSAYIARQTIASAQINFDLNISYSRQSENEDFDRIAKDLDLTPGEQKELHREISKKHYSIDKVWDAAQRILERRDPLGRRGGQPKRK